MKAPWFPFYTGDFLSSPDVQDMEGHEVGAYVLLMARSWQSDTPGYLPDDDYALRRASRMNPEQWTHSKNAVLKKWPVATDKPGYRFNPRLRAEAEKQLELREKKAEAGRLSAERRAAAATQRQQSANTIPTGVEQSATGVGQNGNYSQPQSQPQAKAGRKEGQPTDLPSSSESQSSEKAKGPGAYYPDEAPIFQMANFFAYLDSTKYRGVDKGTYLLRIQRTAEEKNRALTNSQWTTFIDRYLDIEEKEGRLVLPTYEPIKPEPTPIPDDPSDLWFKPAPLAQTA